MSLVILAAACGAGTGDDDGADSSGGDVTLATLPADQRAAFEAWKAQPIKDCLWAQAFSGLAKEALDDRGVPAPVPTPHVDVTALYAGTQGSPLIEDPAGWIVLLGRPIDDSSSSRNELNTTYTRDGQTTRSLSVSAVRDLGDCVVTLHGEEVYRTRMAAAMEITAFAGVGSLDRAGTDVGPLVFDPTHAVGAIDAAPLLAQTFRSLVPVEPARALLAAHFNVAQSEAFQVFSLGQPQLPVTVRPQLAGTPEFAPDAVIYGPSAAIAPFADTTSVALDLLFSDVAPADPGKLVVIHAEIAVGPQGHHAYATSLTVGPAIDRSDAATIECFASRAHLASAFLTAAAPRLPGFDAVFSSCRDLAVDGYAALVSDPASRQRIASATFTGPITSTTAYLGWDTVFLDVVDRLRSAGGDLAALDPDHVNPALDVALTRATTWLQAVPAGAPAELRAAVVPTSLRWTLDAVSILTELDGLIPQSFANAGASYPTSVLRMMNDVTAGVTGGLAAARCGASLSGDRGARVAATLAHAAALPEAEQFTGALRDQLLQVCPDDATLARIDAAVDAARAFVTEDLARGPGVLFTPTVRLLVDHALRETWAPETYIALGDLLALPAARGGCLSATTYSEQLFCRDSTRVRFSTAHGKLLDPVLVARQVAFARELLPVVQGWLSDAAFVAVRSAILAAFFDRGLWTGCTDQGFAAEQAVLFQALDQLNAAAPTDRPDIEDAIIEQVSATTCR